MSLMLRPEPSFRQGIVALRLSEQFGHLAVKGLVNRAEFVNVPIDIGGNAQLHHAVVPHVAAATSNSDHVRRDEENPADAGRRDTRRVAIINGVGSNVHDCPPALHFPHFVARRCQFNDTGGVMTSNLTQPRDERVRL